MSILTKLNNNIKKMSNRLQTKVALLKNSKLFKTIDFSKAIGNLDQATLIENQLFDKLFALASIQDILDFVTQENLYQYYTSNVEVKLLEQSLNIANAGRIKAGKETYEVDAKYFFDEINEKIPRNFALKTLKFEKHNLSRLQFVAEKAQVFARVISFLKTNYGKIYNKINDSEKENSRETFDNLENTLKTYARIYAGSSIETFITNFTDYQNVYNITTESSPSEVIKAQASFNPSKLKNILLTNKNRELKKLDQIENIAKEAKTIALQKNEINNQTKKWKDFLNENNEVLNKIQNLNDENIKNSYDKINEIFTINNDTWFQANNDEISNRLYSIAKDFEFVKTNASVYKINQLKSLAQPEENSIINPIEVMSSEIEVNNDLPQSIIDFIEKSQDENSSLRVFAFKDENGKEEKKLFSREQLDVLKSLRQTINYNKNQDNYLNQYIAENISSIESLQKFTQALASDKKFEELPVESVNILELILKNASNGIDLNLTKYLDFKRIKYSKFVEHQEKINIILNNGDIVASSMQNISAGAALKTIKMAQKHNDAQLEKISGENGAFKKVLQTKQKNSNLINENLNQLIVQLKKIKSNITTSIEEEVNDSENEETELTQKELVSDKANKLIETLKDIINNKKDNFMYMDTIDRHFLTDNIDTLISFLDGEIDENKANLIKLALTTEQVESLKNTLLDYVKSVEEIDEELKKRE